MRTTLIFFFTLSLTACGYKGSLYLPESTPSTLDALAPKSQPIFDEPSANITDQETS